MCALIETCHFAIFIAQTIHAPLHIPSSHNFWLLGQPQTQSSHDFWPLGQPHTPSSHNFCHLGQPHTPSSHNFCPLGRPHTSFSMAFEESCIFPYRKNVPENSQSPYYFHRMSGLSDVFYQQRKRFSAIRNPIF